MVKSNKCPVIKSRERAKKANHNTCIIPQFSIYIIFIVIDHFLILGQMYDIAWGQKLFKKCHGKGSPTGDCAF